MPQVFRLLKGGVGGGLHTSVRVCIGEDDRVHRLKGVGPASYIYITDGVSLSQRRE